MKDFGIKEALTALGLGKSNLGVSTGLKWFRSTGGLIDSYSPADGRRIGSVYAGDEKTFHKVVAKSQEAFKEWRT
ncbi:MAG: aldehyde dehydrogenase family protein, partial [Marivirga sp.]|nr:aldehyde dehydrogenase family protein [Marivirga sp.]